MIDLHQAAVEYLRVRRALGFKLRGHDRLLADFIVFLDRAGVSVPTTALAVSWATGPADRVQPVRCAQRLCAVRGFVQYLHALDSRVEVPPADLLSCRRQRSDPYLYSPEDISALIIAAGLLRPVFRAATYRALFGLLAATGMRVGEAIGLDRDDVDLDAGVLVIRQAKFGKQRRLPLHPSTTTALRGYAIDRDRQQRRVSTPSFFVSTRGTRLIYECVHVAFTQMLARGGLTVPAGTAKPRIHGLRHSFAVSTLRDWYRDGADVATKLPILSAYLGHAHPASTYWYLSAAPDLLALAAQRLENAEGGER